MESTTTTSRLQQKLIENAKKEAEKIILEAKREAEKIIEEARKAYESKVSETREKIISEAKRKAEEIIVDAKIRARMIIAEEKKKIIDSVFKQVEEIIKSAKFDKKESLLQLLKESIKEIGLDKVKVIVSKQDLGIIKEIKKTVEKELSVKIVEVTGSDKISGGVIVESMDGKIRINNTYEERLASAKSKLAPMIVRKVLE